MEPLKLDAQGNPLLPQPDEISRREKDDAMGAYLMMFAAIGISLPLPVINLIASVIYYVVNRNKSRFVAFHSHQSLITQLPISVFNLIAFGWLIQIFFFNFDAFVEAIEFFDYATFPTQYLYLFGFIIFIFLWNSVYMVFSIIGSTKAYRGRFFYMPFFGIVSFNKFYGAKAVNNNLKPAKSQNAPPPGYTSSYRNRDSKENVPQEDKNL